MKDRWLGLDIGGTKCAVVLAELRGGIHVLDKARFATRAEEGFAGAYERLVGEAKALLARNDAAARLRAVGVSCGGPLDARHGVVLCPPNLPGWENVPLTRMLTEAFGVPAYLMNDANACALAEWKLGAGRGAEDMVFLTMGTGMGAGVISGGKLLCGHADMAGEVGHLRLAEDGPVGFGKAGSFEGFTSGGGIQRQAEALTLRLTAEGKPPAWARDGHARETWDARLLAEYARRGDADALALFGRVGRMLGRGIALIVDMFNPERVVVGSIFARCEDLLRPAMADELRREAIPFSLRKLSVVPAACGESVGDYASVMAALYAQKIDPLTDAPNERVLARYERLFARYPALAGCQEAIWDAYELLRAAYRAGHRLLLVGNGGSCADCEHIAGELMKGFWLKRPLDGALKAKLKPLTDAILPDAENLLQQGLPVIVLTGHAALSTAAQNDEHPLLAPAQQVMALGEAGDVILGISTSGNADNVALAVCAAKAKGMTAIALTGGSGGRLRTLCDAAIIAPADTPAEVQEYHLPIYHALCAMLEAAFFSE